MVCFFDGVGEDTLDLSVLVPCPLNLILTPLSSFGFSIAVTSNGGILSRLTRASSTLSALELSPLSLLLFTGGDSEVVLVVLSLGTTVTQYQCLVYPHHNFGY